MIRPAFVTHEGGVMKGRRIAVCAIAAVAVAVGVGVGIGSAGAAATKPIIIGYAADEKGQMSPFDDPALAAAQLEVNALNATGGVKGRKFKIVVCDTQNNNATTAKSCALNLLSKGASVLFTTCDVDYATPVVQQAISRGVLAIAPCIGTDQMGPKRFGAKGKLAFSFGNVAQDEGAAMANFAYKVKHWKTADIVTNNLLVYFQNVTAAFESRFKQLGGKIVAHESFTSFDNTIQNVVSRVNGEKANVVVTSTSFGELPALVSGLRSLGNNTAILNSWAGDGTYWVTKSPPVTNYFAVTYASVFGDDPSTAVRGLIAKLTAEGHAPATGGFVAGASAVDGLAVAIRRAGGKTSGAALAAQLAKFKNVQTISGKISFSNQFHTVFGRPYRVIEINNNKGKYIGMISAGTPAKI
jgi:branched-chain amino acid transport system substrate-binding protein